MKRGNTEVACGIPQSAKKVKIEDTPSTTLQGSSSTPNQDQTDGWTKVEKRKKKKEVKLLDDKRDVRTVTPITNRVSVFMHHVADHYHHCYFLCTNHESEVYVLES